MTKFIYVLEIDNIPVYVGSTSDIKTRLTNHKSSKRFKDNKDKLSLRILEKYTGKNTASIESKWLNKFKSEGFILLNINKPCASRKGGESKQIRVRTRSYNKLFKMTGGLYIVDFVSDLIDERHSQLYKKGGRNGVVNSKAK